MRTMARSSSKRYSARARASSVLPTPGGAQEQEAADGAVGVRQAGPGAPDGVGDDADGRLLAHDPLLEVLLEVEELLHLALHEAAHRHAGPLGHDLGDVLLVDLLLQHAQPALELVEALAGLVDPALELGDEAVADLGGPLEVGLALHVGPSPLQLLLQGADGADGVLLGLPVARPCRPCAR